MRLSVILPSIVCELPEPCPAQGGIPQLTPAQRVLAQVGYEPR